MIQISKTIKTSIYLMDRKNLFYEKQLCACNLGIATTYFSTDKKSYRSALLIIFKRSSSYYWGKIRVKRSIPEVIHGKF